MAEYRFKNENGDVITTKNEVVANDYRVRPGFTEVTDEKKTPEKKS